MKLDPAEYKVYRLGGDGRRVAINRENHKVLEHHLGLFGELRKVPVDKTVRGIFVKELSAGDIESVDETLQQQDITICELRL